MEWDSIGGDCPASLSFKKEIQIIIHHPEGMGLEALYD